MRLCVDVGGSKVAVMLADAQGLIPTTRCEAPTVRTGAPDALVGQVLLLADQALARARALGRDAGPVRAVGVSACGPFVRHDGALALASPNLCGGLAGDGALPNAWRQIPLEAGLWPELRRRFGPAVQLALGNDAVAALQAERLWGALQGESNCAYVTWSTGIGVGLCVDGRVLQGKHGNAGHAGHSIVADDPASPLCGCGNRGDVEALAGGAALARRLDTDVATLMAAAARGEPAAAQVAGGLCAVVGRLLYNLVVTLDLQAISLGGGILLHHADWLLPRLRQEVAARLPALTAGVRIEAAGLGHAVADHAARALAEAALQRGA